MKRLYYSAVIPGLEETAARMLKKEGGVSVEQTLTGGVLYRSIRTPDFAFCRRTFLVLARLPGVKDPEAALRRLLASGGWLDNIPYEEAEHVHFRITVSDGEAKVHVNMKNVALLERAIEEQTDMHVDRERPAVELWLISNASGSLFLWHRKEKREQGAGRLPADFADILAFFAGYDKKNAAVLGCRDDGLPRAMLARGARKVACVCPDRESAGRIGRIPGLAAVAAPVAHTGLDTAAFDAVCLNLLPAKDSPAPDGNAVRSALHEAARLTRTGGRLVAVAVSGEAEEAFSRSREWATDGREACTVSGKQVAIRLMIRQSGTEDEE